MAEFNFGLGLSSEHRCSSVGVTEEGTQLATWKLYSVWKQVKTPEDLSVLPKFYPSLIHTESGRAAEVFIPTVCHSAGQNPALLRELKILWDFQYCHSHYSWNRGHWNLREQKVLVERSELVKSAELFEIPPVVSSKYQSDWLAKPWILL